MFPRVEQRRGRAPKAYKLQLNDCRAGFRDEVCVAGWVLGQQNIRLGHGVARL